MPDAADHILVRKAEVVVARQRTDRKLRIVLRIAPDGAFEMMLATVLRVHHPVQHVARVIPAGDAEARRPRERIDPARRGGPPRFAGAPSQLEPHRPRVFDGRHLCGELSTPRLSVCIANRIGPNTRSS
jgi:hypothetical protein